MAETICPSPARNQPRREARSYGGSAGRPGRRGRLACGRRKTCLNLVFPWFSGKLLLEDCRLPEGFLQKAAVSRGAGQGIFEEPTDAQCLRPPTPVRLPGRL